MAAVTSVAAAGVMVLAVAVPAFANDTTINPGNVGKTAAALPNHKCDFGGGPYAGFDVWVFVVDGNPDTTCDSTALTAQFSTCCVSADRRRTLWTNQTGGQQHSGRVGTARCLPTHRAGAAVLLCRPLRTMRGTNAKYQCELARSYGPKPPSVGSEMSGFSSSSTLTSLKVITRTFLTKRAGRYMSHTQASCISTSK